ncbi:MAG TPA: DUF3883 domain-containing protein [Gemmatimonadaceae bacterium]|nr:DUF3883 domain-containing protein [Gemmatimonadaceae bacterium]
MEAQADELLAETDEVASASTADAMVELQKIWSGRLEVLAAELAANEDQRKEIRNAAHHFESDYHGRFLIELLQNSNDQAVRAGLAESRVLIALAPGLLAVANQGRPFDGNGVKSLASLALSEKNPEALLGNKGLGFKSVFEITTAPEVFSVGRLGDTLAAGAATRLRLSADPLSSAALLSELERLAHELFQQDERRRAQVQKRYPHATPESVLLGAVRESAPWRFPVPLEPRDLDARVEQLIIDDLLAGLQTLVVLPLKDQRAERAAAEAVDRLLTQSASAMLFLDAVSTIVAIEQPSGRTRTRGRSIVELAKVARGTTVHEVTIHSSDDPDAEATKKTWWRAQRTIGDDRGIKASEAATERELVNAAAKDLPGDGWAKVHKATVAVALPMDLDGHPEWQPDGRFCIGLPTEEPTGACFWVDAHFHGNASRKAVDFKLTYNKLLLDEAEALVERFVKMLQVAPRIEFRRAATLCLSGGVGPVGQRMWGPSGITRGQVVLDSTGTSFVRADQLRLPRPQTMPLFEAVRGSGDLDAAGFKVPDELLLRQAWPLLERLGAVVHAERGDLRFTRRPPGGLSLLELAARQHRAAGPVYWNAFLEAVLTEFMLPEIEDQKILPVGENELASPSSKVFLEPLRGAPNQPEEDGEVALEDIPAAVKDALRLLDRRAVPQAQETARTPLAKRLQERNLVRAPRKRALVNGLLVPRLRELVGQPDDTRLALQLLKLGLGWILSTPKASFDVEGLLVPVTSADETWAWKAPGSVYFGQGWLPPERDELLESAYGKRTAARLVRWPHFRDAVGAEDDDREWWLGALRRAGVHDAPAIKKVGPLDAFKAYGVLQPAASPCPFPEAAAWWSAYLGSVADGRATRVTSGQLYEFEEVTWIDGLEDAAIRSAVFDLMLASPTEYVAALETTTRRTYDRSDSRPAHSFWKYAIGSAEWPLVPVSHSEARRAAVGDCWILTKEQSRRDFAALVARVPERLLPARTLLERLGVHTWGDAPGRRVIREIHALASRPCKESEHAAVLLLAGELYEALSAGLQDPRAFLAKPVVVATAQRQAKAVDLGKVEKVFVNDDPVRAPFVPGFDVGLQLPVGKRAAKLVALLRTHLGSDRVLRTSDATPDVRFVSESTEVLLMEYLKESFPDGQVALDLGLLVAYLGTREADPRKDEFQANWARFKSLRLVWGRFENHGQAGVRSFYEARERKLYLTAGLGGSRAIAELWRVAGPSYQTAFIAYAGELEGGRARQFFASQGLDDWHQRLVEEVIGWGSGFRYEHLRSVLFAVWRSHEAAPTSVFEDLWSRLPPTADEVARTFGAPAIGSALVEATGLPEEDAALKILPAADLAVKTWQVARAELGLALHAFKRSTDAFASATSDLVARLTSEASRRRALDLEALTDSFQTLARARPPEGFDQDIRTPEEALEAALDVVITRLASVPEAQPLVPLLEKVRALPPAERLGEVRALGTQREAELYLRQTPETRAQAARQVVLDLLTLAVALAARRGEPADSAAIAADRRVQQLSQGFWANKFSVIAAVREALEGVAPKTTQAMSEGNAFKVVATMAELWRPHEPELGPREAPIAPPRRLQILNVEVLEDEFKSDFAKSGNGRVGAALRSKVDPTLDLAALANGPRDVLPDLPAKSDSTGSRGEGSRHGKVPNGRKFQEVLRDQQNHGLLGEAFVFEQLRATLPGFDATCWESEAADAYGVGSGEDGRGYDFRYLDSEGRLTARTDQPECLIEVKTTSGDGTGPFIMTAKEWSVALETHLAAAKGQSRQVYVIVRVANVLVAPSIVDCIIDPVAQQAANRLRRYEHAVLVTVGRRSAGLSPACVAVARSGFGLAG